MVGCIPTRWCWQETDVDAEGGPIERYLCYYHSNIQIVEKGGPPNKNWQKWEIKRFLCTGTGKYNQ